MLHRALASRAVNILGKLKAIRGAFVSATHTIFLSYSRTDLAAANELRTQLQAAGLDVFKDDARLHSGDRWMALLQEAVAGCHAFVVLVGQDGVQRWVGAEVEVALNRHFSPRAVAEVAPWRLPLHPILLGDTLPNALPPFLALFQSVRWQQGQPLPNDLKLALENGRLLAPRADAKPSFEGCPYLGLGSFKLKDASIFFGRTRETLEALRYLGDQQERGPHALQLRDGSIVSGNSDAKGQVQGAQGYARWLQVEGHSGSGKSSLVQAGLLPMIERGALWPRTGYIHWRVLGPMVPGPEPVVRLAEALEHALVPDAAQRSMQTRLERLLSPQDAQAAQALAFALRDAKQPDTAFLLLIDQFEELYTLAEAPQRQRFDALLARALTDPDCPLFVISTVRSDFVDRMPDELPALAQIVNTCCRRYLLPTISADGLREAIEGPARLAGLDVSEVTELMLEQARGEPGALPLVEHALQELWAERQPPGATSPGSQAQLSRRRFVERGGLAGMLSSAADNLLVRIDNQIKGGRSAALELLLRLTRIDPAGGQAPRHTRRRISRAEAVQVAGDGNDKLGQQVLQMLSGHRDAALPADNPQGSLRLVTVEGQGVDLIHETLLRTQAQAGQGSEDGHTAPKPYWPTLYEHIARNRGRDVRRQQLAWQVEAWQGSRWWGAWRHLAGWGQIRAFSRLRLARRSVEGRFLHLSRWALGSQAVLLFMLAAVAESWWWAGVNNLPPSYIGHQLRWYLSLAVPALAPVPVTVHISVLPTQVVSLPRVCAMGIYEVTFLEYDYFIWTTGGKLKSDRYPKDEGWGRDQRPAINVSWTEAMAYVKWLSGQTGQIFRLPTEVEWEYAARHINESYPWGAESPQGRANCYGCNPKGSAFSGRTAPVGSYPSGRTQDGLFDIVGNVWEWMATNDRPEDHFESGVRVLRGGSWDSLSGNWFSTRSDGRPDSHDIDIGFRVCRGSPNGMQATDATKR
jgi:hypothetical protein